MHRKKRALNLKLKKSFSMFLYIYIKVKNYLAKSIFDRFVKKHQTYNRIEKNS